VFTTVILWLIAIGWLVANGMWAQKPSRAYARRRSVWAWALAGGCVGALAGWALAGLPFAGALAGAFAGALMGSAVAGLVAGRRTKGPEGGP
jgi:outer membrane lipoprotein SlyB